MYTHTKAKRYARTRSNTKHNRHICLHLCQWRGLRAQGGAPVFVTSRSMLQPLVCTIVDHSLLAETVRSSGISQSGCRTNHLTPYSILNFWRVVDASVFEPFSYPWPLNHTFFLKFFGFLIFARKTMYTSQCQPFKLFL